MAAREVELVGQHFLSCMGRAEDWDPEQFDQVCVVDGESVVVGAGGSTLPLLHGQGGGLGP